MAGGAPESELDAFRSELTRLEDEIRSQAAESDRKMAARRDELMAPVVERLGNVLREVTKDPGRPISELQMLSREERWRSLVAWNDTATPYPAQATLDELFEDVAARTPDAVALEFGSDSTTCGELDRRATAFARRLRRHGVGHRVA